MVYGKQLTAFPQSLSVAASVCAAEISPIALEMPLQCREQFTAGNGIQYARGGHEAAGREFLFVCQRDLISYTNARNPLGVRTLKIMRFVMVSLISETMCCFSALYCSSVSARTCLTIRPLMM